MRTTIDLPDDLHRAAVSIARDHGQTLSQTVAQLLRKALHAEAGAAVADQRDGFPLLRTARALTQEDVRTLDDEG